jgi:hypothetical protein
MSALLVLLALLSVATLASRRGAFDDVIAHASAPVLVALGAFVGPSGLSYVGPSIVSGLEPALAVGLVWLAFLAGLGAVDTRDAAAAASPVEERARLVAIAGAIFGVGALAAVVAGGRLVGIGLEGVDDLDLAALAVLALLGVTLAALRIHLPDNDAEVTAPGTADVPRALALLSYARAAERLALAAAAGAFAIAGELRGIVVIGLGLFAAAIVHLLARQPAVPPSVATLGAILLLTGFARLAEVPAAVAGLVAGAVFTLGRRADDLARPLVATERPVRIAVTAVLGMSVAIGVPELIAGAALGLAVAAAHLVVAAVLGGWPRSTMKLWRGTRAVGGTSTTPLLVVAALAGVAVPGAAALLPVVLVAVAVADTVAFALSLAARRGQP